MNDTDMRQWAVTMASVMTGQRNMITIPRVFVDLTGNLEAAALLNQILFWSSTKQASGGGGWFYKSYVEWEDELCISEYKVRKYVKQFEDFGVETKLKKAGGAPTIHYRVDFKTFSQSFILFLKNSGMDSEKTSGSITENTTDDKDHDPNGSCDSSQSDEPPARPKDTPSASTPCEEEEIGEIDRIPDETERPPTSDETHKKKTPSISSRRAAVVRAVLDDCGAPIDYAMTGKLGKDAANITDMDWLADMMRLIVDIDNVDETFVLSYAIVAIWRDLLATAHTMSVTADRIRDAIPPMADRYLTVASITRHLHQWIESSRTDEGPPDESIWGTFEAVS